MLDDAKQAVGLEQAADRQQIGIEPAPAPHVVHFAEDQRAIDLAVEIGGQAVGIEGKDALGGDAGPLRRLRREGRAEVAEGLLRPFGRVGDTGIEADIPALRPEVGHQDARVPSARRQIVHHRHARLHAEEAQRFGGVTPDIAGTVTIAARIGQHRRHCRRCCGGGQRFGLDGGLGTRPATAMVRLAARAVRTVRTRKFLSVGIVRKVAEWEAMTSAGRLPI
jgi:hypothetical protein